VWALTGDTGVDAEIASVLGAPSHPYTSNDTYAQTLLPPGWSWTSATECVRAADSLTISSAVSRSDGMVVPDPITRCLGAV
jgi:hypothetical protein